MMRHVFVISDLHVGGRPDPRPDEPEAPLGTQINRSVRALTAFIRWLVAQHDAVHDGELELVVNGDVVDFLAEDQLGAALWTADEGQAILKLELAVERSRGGATAGVFEAMAELLAAGHRLTLLLGNHDVELALPKVRERLHRLLTGGDDRRLLRFLYDNEAYTVGRLLVEHGNRYDRWNMIDHNGLRAERSVRSRLLPVDESERAASYFQPPAGTHLVVGFMNRIKARYRFVDLLKPETDAVIPLLVALEPDHWPVLDDIVKLAPLGRQLLAHKLDAPARPKRPGDLTASGSSSAPPSLEAVLRETLGRDSQAFAAKAPVKVTARPAGPGDMGLFSRAGKWVEARVAELRETQRSASRIFAVWDGGELSATAADRMEQLHLALRAVARDDRTYRTDYEVPQYLESARATVATGDFDVVIYGHTHLPKQIDLGGGAQYLNTGTWADVMRLPDALVDEGSGSRAALLEFVAALRDNRLDPYIQRYLSYVEARIADDGTVREAVLRSYCGRGNERAPALTGYAAREP
jgi:UDP-2,3-diacylglucosamine pyrophosphatase LpxH